MALKQYNKPHMDIKKSEANLITDANIILIDYESNEEKANIKYTNNIIQIKGLISEISTYDGNVTITLKDKNFDASIICNLLPEENFDALQLKKGKEISIKGICTGYLLDVILIKCVIVK